MKNSIFASVLLLTLVYAAQAQETAANAFNPDISLILSSRFNSFSQDPSAYALPGYALGAETGPGERGFSLGESELVMSANVDAQFYGFLVAALTPENEVELEEAYVGSLGSIQGANIKAGRFLSQIGYLNSRHSHVWDFADVALAYRAFLANQYRDDGIQLRWLAPTDIFLELGGEWLRGDRFPAAGAADKGRGAVSFSLRLGADAGVSHSWRVGVSQLRSEAQQRLTGDLENAPDGFSGASQINMAEFVWKWAPLGNAKRKEFVLQAEYLSRKESGIFTADVNGTTPNADSYVADQAGWYVQGVYRFMPRWRVGLRYDALQTHSLVAGTNSGVLDTLGHDPRRSSVMLDFTPSEFSRLRAQFNRDNSRLQMDNQIFVQYVMSLGAHGAHAY